MASGYMHDGLLILKKEMEAFNMNSSQAKTGVTDGSTQDQGGGKYYLQIILQRHCKCGVRRKRERRTKDRGRREEKRRD